MMLKDARLRLHAAAQWLARLGFAYAAHADDDSHAALTWQGDDISTGPLGEAGHCATINARTLEFQLGDRAIALEGLSEAAREGAVRKALTALGYDAAALKIALPWGDEAPSADAAPKSAQENIDALADLYHAASVALEAVQRTEAGASPLRLWPHHFDIATLITGLPGAADDASIGVGMAPDDANFDTPYFYVTPWPYPDGALPDPPKGWHWHSKGFTALIAPVTAASQLGNIDLGAAIAQARKCFA